MRSQIVEVVDCKYSFVFMKKDGIQVEQETIIPMLSSMALPIVAN